MSHFHIGLSIKLTLLLRISNRENQTWHCAFHTCYELRAILFLMNCNGKCYSCLKIVPWISDAKNGNTFDSLQSKFVTSMYCVSLCNGGCVGQFDRRSYNLAQCWEANLVTFLTRTKQPAKIERTATIFSMMPSSLQSLICRRCTS